MKTKKDILDHLENADAELVRAHFIKFVNKNVFSKLSLELLISIVKGQKLKEKKPHVSILSNEVIPYNRLKALSQSPIIEYIDHLVRAAEAGPMLSTTDIMLRTQIVGEPTPYFIKASGISQADRTHAGFILTLAGFERTTAYYKDTRSTYRARRLRHPYALTIEQRIIRVRAEIFSAVIKHEEGKEEPKSVLEELI